tara:strand:+ start:361 stop:2493 length:2133 start_codon:yes stop_codon:yes gene_type:complete
MEYLKSRINLISFPIYFLIGFFCTVLFLGFENVSFTNVDWIFHGKDMTHHYVGWSYFKNDAWRFPLGLNPQYGLENASSIIYTDSIPLLAFLFKIFKSYLPNNFQYFSLWIFLCFFLQGLFSFKLINYYTKNINYSFITSLFFLIAPVFLFRISFHLALGAHWLLLASFYIQTFQSEKIRNLLWNILIPVSLLIHFYLAASCIIIYGIFLVKESLENKNLVKVLKKSLTSILIILFVMYLSGYFVLPAEQTLGVGYGNLKLNLLGIFDPYQLGTVFESWSLFLPDLPSKIGEHEGFSYIGLGGILLVIFSLYLIIIDLLLQKKLLKRIFTQKKVYIFIFLIFFIFSLSNKIDIGNYNLFNVKINEYIFGLFSILRASGRLFWPAYYLILIFCVVFLFRSISPKKSFTIILFLLFIQIIDTSAGFKQLLFSKKFEPNYLNLSGDIWRKIADEKKIIRTTYVRNATEIFLPLSYYLSENNIKTDIFWQSRYDRKKAAEKRYTFYKNLDKGIIGNDPYIIGKKNHLLYIKETLAEKDVGFFFRNNFWIVFPQKKDEMNEKDIIEYKNIDYPLIKLNNKIIPTQNKYDQYFGIGWTHNFSNPGFWSEGYVSTLLFKIEANQNDNFLLELAIEPSKINLKKLNFNVFINGTLYKKYDSGENYDFSKLFINLEKDINNTYKIDFKFSNLDSALDLLESPDARKLGFLVKEIKVKKR